MKKAKCPACKTIIKLPKGTKVQDIITCPNCKSILELVELHPPVLDWAEDPEVFSSRRIYNKMF